MTKRLWQLIPIILIFYLFTSCTSSSNTKYNQKANESSVVIEKNLTHIEQEAPQLKSYTEAIRSEVKSLVKLAIRKEVSSLEKYLPWVIAVGGLGWLAWGLSTKSPKDTIGGAVGFVVSVVIATFWDIVAWIGLGGLLLFMFIWVVTMWDLNKDKYKKD